MAQGAEVIKTKKGRLSHFGESASDPTEPEGRKTMLRAPP